MDLKSFSQAVDYVNRNQDTWNRMIERCYDEWAFDLVDGSNFNQYVLDQYGIKVDPKSYNHLNYQVVDPKKYTLFQIKFT